MKIKIRAVSVAAIVLWVLFATPLPAETDLSALKRRVSSEIEKQKISIFKELKAAPGEMLAFDVLIYKNTQGDYWTHGAVKIWKGKAPLEPAIASARVSPAEDKLRRTPSNDTYRYSAESYMFGVKLESSTVRMFPVNRPARGTIYLTFDDGPNRGTSVVLTALKEANLKGTFFVLGSNQAASVSRTEQKTLFDQIVADGHRIGNHTFTHLPFKVSQYADAYHNPLTDSERVAFAKNYTDNQKYFQDLAGSPVIFKMARLPGHGKMVPNLVAETKSLGLKHCGWDWEFAPNGTLSNVSHSNWQNISGVASDHSQGDLPANGSIILFHDAHWKGKTALLTKVIEHLASDGYKFDVLAD